LSSPMRLAGTDHADGHCDRLNDLPSSDYAYVLGLYLGDGCISNVRGRPRKLRVFCCDDYPQIMAEAAAAMAAVMPSSKVGRVRKQGCTELCSHSIHWPCVLPQHGPGKKHQRPIVVEPWQLDIAMAGHPHQLLRGLVHSDGCRTINRVRGANGQRHEYPRYFFSNESADIRSIFLAACAEIGVDARHNRHNSISVARRESVAILDGFIGPKR
jgi:hypothetical protein